MVTMNRFDELLGPIAQPLREVLHEAALVAHRVNGERFEPEELGDDGLIYGIATTTNARHLAARAIEERDLDGVHVRERGRVWWLEIEHPDLPSLRVYFYKAPPAARSVYAVRFEDAEVKTELGTNNGLQLELFNRNGEEGSADLSNLMVVHFGDSDHGLEKLEVGAPFILRGEVAWEWYERFDAVDEAGATAEEEHTSLGDDGEGFEGLRLAHEDYDDSAENMKQATSEFDGLGLRDEETRDDEDQEADADRDEQ